MFDQAAFFANLHNPVVNVLETAFFYKLQQHDPKYDFFVNSNRNRGEGEKINIILELRIEGNPLSAFMMENFFSNSEISIKSASAEFSIKDEKFHHLYRSAPTERIYGGYETHHLQATSIISKSWGEPIFFVF